MYRDWNSERADHIQISKNVDISSKTVFKQRHQLFSQISKYFNTYNDTCFLTGSLECDILIWMWFDPWGPHLTLCVLTFLKDFLYFWGCNQKLLTFTSHISYVPQWVLSGRSLWKQNYKIRFEYIKDCIKVYNTLETQQHAKTYITTSIYLYMWNIWKSACFW